MVILFVIYTSSGKNKRVNKCEKMLYIWSNQKYQLFQVVIEFIYPKNKTLTTAFEITILYTCINRVLKISSDKPGWHRAFQKPRISAAFTHQFCCHQFYYSVNDYVLLLLKY